MWPFSKPNLVKTLHIGKHLKLLSRDDWEYVERPNVDKIAYIVPILKDEDGNNNFIFIREFRVPFQKHIISFPAGLIGDHDKDETIIDGALRELVEEIGYTGALVPLTRGPTSAGLSNEILDFFMAVNLEKVVGGGQGDGTEHIETFIVPVEDAYEWIQAQSDLIDSKVYLGLYFACRYLDKVI